LYWHNSKLIDFIIRLAPLRRRISFGYILTFLTFLIIALITYTTSTNTIKEVEHFTRYSKQSQLDLQFVKNIVELELSVSRYIHDGHDSAAINVQSLYIIMQEQLKQGLLEIQTDDIESRLIKIKLLLDDYIVAFEKVKIQRKIQSDLINVQFRETGTKIEELLQTYTKKLTLDSSSSDLKLTISQVSNSLLSVEKDAFRYFDTLDLKYINLSKKNLKSAIFKLQLQSNHATNNENYQIIKELVEKISLYEKIFLEGVQRTRGYLYLINVVMSADAYEMLYESKKISDTLKYDIEKTEKNILTNIYRYLSVLTITIIFFLILMIILSYLIGLTVTKPINQLTQIFNKLVHGSKDKINITSVHHDEISELVYAAEMFRDKNIKIQSLLDKYKSLNDTLEKKVGERTQELKEKNDELNILAITDNLTGIYNRVKLNKELNKEIKRCERYGEIFSVIIIDIDNFKSINDSYGHQSGDTILAEFSQVLTDTLRETDILGRWGGEEFLILSPETDKEGILSLAEKIRRAVETYSFTAIKKVTASFGTATYINEDQYKMLIERADKALYRAKGSGKNQVQSG